MPPSLTASVAPARPALDARSRSDALWRRYRGSTPDRAVEEELVCQYIPLVKTVVGRLALALPSHIKTEDLYSAGLVGLLNALRHYNPKLRTSFESYARVRIRGAILDELRRMDWVPRSVHEKARKIQAAMEQIEQLEGRAATEVEVAQTLGLSLREYESWLDDIRPVSMIYLDTPMNQGAETEASLHEVVADANHEDPAATASRHELTHIVAERLQQLPEMQRKVLAFYYFEDMRLQEIADIFGVTESRICQIHVQALMSIRAFLNQQEAAPRPLTHASAS